MSTPPVKPEERETRTRVTPRRGAGSRATRKESEELDERSKRLRALVARGLVWAGISLFCGVVLAPPTIASFRDYKAGDIAASDIKAPRDLSVEDNLSTAQRRREAMDSVIPIYDYDEDAARNLGTQVSTYFGAMRQNLRAVWDLEDQIKTVRRRSSNAVELKELRAKLQEAHTQADGSVPDPLKIFNKEIDRNVLGAFAKLRYSAELETRINRAIEQILRPGVIGSRDDLPADPNTEITVRRVPSNLESVVEDLSSFQSLETVRTQAGAIVKEWVGEITQNQDVIAASTKLVRLLLRPNLAKNIQATDAKREFAASQVKPVYLNLKAGEIFVREGERIAAEDIIIISALSGEQRSLLRWLNFLAVSVVAALAFGLFYLFASRHMRFFRGRLTTNDLQFYAIILAIELVLVRVVPDAWQWGGYTAYGAMLIRLLLPAEIAFIHAAIASILGGFIVSSGPLYTVYSLIACMLAIVLVGQYQHRMVLIRAGAVIGALNILGYWADLFLFHDQMWPRNPSHFAMLGGLGVAGSIGFVYLFSELAERVFRYTSAIRLMELNDTSHPLVKEVFFKTPGTYQHSLVIGTIAEAAAKAIGGDALLLRVAALYHDIGKTKMPQYFIENMPDGGKGSPHNKLSPSMSAIIISSHVKDGIEMARKSGLPQKVIDMIPQHHGTKLMKYFWGKAQEGYTPEMPPLREDDFRYPGPKPQSREAGIMLLADAAEAAIRTLPEFTEARIRGAIQKIVNDAFADGQLSECDLTLRDLNEIAKAFTATLAAFHHHRIKYPEPAEKQTKKKKAAPEDGDSDKKAPPADQGADGAGSAPREENLKRLGSS